MTNTSATSSYAVRSTVLVLFAASSLVAVALGSATLRASGLPFASWLRNPVAWLVGVVLAMGMMRVRHSAAVFRVLLGLALVGVAGSFLAPAQEGVHRWIDVGPLHINIAALLLPSAIVALAFTGISSRTGIAFATVAAALLVLQPDASQATSFAIAVMILVARSTAPAAPGVIAVGAALLVAVVSWMRPDPLQPVPEVEGIFPLAVGVSPALAIIAVLALAAASLAPLAIRTTAGAAHRNAALALTGYFVSAAICPAFGAFPVPLVGLGMSFPVGYWLAIGLLCAKGTVTQNAARD